MIRNVQIEDSQAIADIYNHFVLETIVTFDETTVPASFFKAKIQDITRSYPWFVWIEDETLMGYAYASEWNERSAYHQTVETTIYLGPDFVNLGIGTKLYSALIDSVKSDGAHTVIGGISLPNKGSVALHEKMGYQKVAHYKEVGYKFGRYIDVGYWQKIL